MEKERSAGKTLGSKRMIDRQASSGQIKECLTHTRMSDGRRLPGRKRVFGKPKNVRQTKVICRTKKLRADEIILDK